MLHLEGEKTLSRPRGEVWAKLADLHFLVRCIPDAGETAEVQENSATVKIRPSFSFVRGELKLTIEKLAQTPAESAQFRLSTKGIGTTSEVEVEFRLADQDSGTLLHWTADVKRLGGLLKAVPQGLIQAGAQKIIDELLARVEAQLGDAS
jgi:carbon monoxide dehydrogenase subunit G